MLAEEVSVRAVEVVVEVPERLLLVEGVGVVGAEPDDLAGPRDVVGLEEVDRALAPQREAVEEGDVVGGEDAADDPVLLGVV